jgi:hypothetical protein
VDEAADIKPDPEATPRKSSRKLHEYNPDELAKFKQKELIGDVELLDGTLGPILEDPYSANLRYRETQERETRP